MNRKIFDQIMRIRDSGMANMLDYRAVQRIAFHHNMYELVNYIEEEPNRYFHFILYGKEAPSGPTETGNG